MTRAIPIRVDDGGSALYVSERKVYPREVSGRYDTLRRVAVVVLLGLFYAGPWLRWDGRQAVLFDLPARRFDVLGLTFWPQDFIFLALLLIAAGMALFFFTTLAGRLWCGYACPQTVWTETFIWLERWTEGDRRAQMKRDAGPWTRDKIVRKSAKHALWVLFAGWTGFTFVGFFSPIDALAARIWPFAWSGWETFWVCFYAFATWGNAGFLREQVCKYMCPYARFQSAMFDRDTLIIAYDTARADDCIDCTLCVQACPTGIDIRNGLQYECIACGACIDACEPVMDKVRKPRGLIRYATQNALDRRPTRILRPRVVVYGTILATVLSAWAWGVTHRGAFRAEVLRDRNALFRRAADGAIENVYTAKIVHRGRVARTYTLAVVDGDATITVAGGPARAMASPEAVLSLPFALRAPDGAVTGRRDVRLRVASDDPAAEPVELVTAFFGPTP